MTVPGKWPIAELQMPANTVNVAVSKPNFFKLVSVLIFLSSPIKNLRPPSGIKESQ